MSERFGNYQLLEHIGGGGLGEVYRAKTLISGAQVGGHGEQVLALKRLNRAHLESLPHRELFGHERQNARGLAGTRLFAAIDEGEVDGWPFLLTRLASGSLRAEMGAPAAPGRLAQIASDLGAALSELHQHGLVHCDLNPSNLLVEDERLGLCDFGSCTAIGSRQRQTQGSFAYMSPEQVRGLELDIRSDVFSAAVLLWECASGRKLFQRSAQHLVLAAVVEDDVPAIHTEMRSDRDAELARAIDAALRPALQKDPAARYRSADELCTTLGSAIAPWLEAG